MSGKEIFEAVYDDIWSRHGPLPHDKNSPSILRVVDSMDTFQKSTLYDLLEAVVDPENYILTEDKKKIIRITRDTMTPDQHTVLYGFIGYAQAMFAH